MKKLIALALALAVMVAIGCSIPKSTVTGTHNDGMFAILCDPGSAEVYIDGDLIGKASRFDGSPGYLQVASGTHRLELKKDGYKTFVRDIYSSNTIQEIRVTLTPVSE